uniref:alpha-(1,3)-fucosyltransferase 7-like n=1 Tax=Monopterus albus TaxID=43700 RepID=UPI0009B325C3|nr:alpha-(1,3)-fucosyltransferase 7-like [Monopterus albus]
MTILVWYWPFNTPMSLEGDVCWDLYHIPRCKLVDQHFLFPSADVVVFHNRELVRGQQKLPLDLPRPQGQTWARMSMDYITEKLWRNAYQGGAVPVVLGPPISDYKDVAPPNSFIHVDEFASVRDLRKFLQELAKDKKSYAEYFSWKKQWKVKMFSDWREKLCKICTKYNSLPQHKVYSDLQSWDKNNNTTSIGKL